MRVLFSETRTNATKIEPVKLKQPLNDKMLQVVEGLVVSPFVDIARSLNILWCVWRPPFVYPHLNLEFQYLT